MLIRARALNRDNMVHVSYYEFYFRIMVEIAHPLQSQHNLSPVRAEKSK